MPVSLEQWRASVGLINAAGSYILAKCGRRRSEGCPYGVSDLLRLLSELFLLLLVLCVCGGAWLVFELAEMVKKVGSRKKRNVLKQLLLVTALAYEGLWPFYKQGSYRKLKYDSYMS